MSPPISFNRAGLNCLPTETRIFPTASSDFLLRSFLLRSPDTVAAESLLSQYLLDLLQVV